MTGEKTEKPTPKRRKESRKEGQVPRTPELGAWATMLVVAMAFPTLFGRELEALTDVFTRTLTAADGDVTVEQATGLLGSGLMHALLVLLVLGSGVLLVGVSSAVAQGGFFVATKSVKPSFGKLNPLKGAKRIFGPQALWEGAKMLLKSAVVALFVYTSINAMLPLLGGLMPVGLVLDVAGAQIVTMIRNVALVGLLMAGADYAMQRRRIGKQTRMSKEEVRQEHRQAEGDPLLKSAVRSRQMAASRGRMMADVPLADAVLVNPTHVAVALRYDPEKGAPRVMARGADAIALRIKETATEAGVPVVEDVPLARALYVSTRVGQEIPPELFEAVAQVLAFVISRRSKGRSGGSHRSPRTESSVPAVLPAGRRRRNPSGPPVASR